MLTRPWRSAQTSRSDDERRAPGEGDFKALSLPEVLEVLCSSVAVALGTPFVRAVGAACGLASWGIVLLLLGPGGAYQACLVYAPFQKAIYSLGE